MGEGFTPLVMEEFNLGVFSGGEGFMSVWGVVISWAIDMMFFMLIIGLGFCSGGFHWE